MVHLCITLSKTKQLTFIVNISGVKCFWRTLLALIKALDHKWAELLLNLQDVYFILAVTRLGVISKNKGQLVKFKALHRSRILLLPLWSNCHSKRTHSNSVLVLVDTEIMAQKHHVNLRKGGLLPCMLEFLYCPCWRYGF